MSPPKPLYLIGDTAINILIHPCRNCGKAFEANPSRVKHGRELDCSRVCSYEYRGRQKRQELFTNCARCSKEIKTTESRIEKARDKFCSKECANPISLVCCMNCGKEFRRAISAIKNSCFCSTDCAYSSDIRKQTSKANHEIQMSDPKSRDKWEKGIKTRTESESWRKNNFFQKGALHPFFSNGKSRARVIDYKYKQWRKAVFARDGFKCQHCGENKYLNAHHIKSWAKFPEDRYLLENGISLCVLCHLKVHGKKPKSKI